MAANLDLLNPQLKAKVNTLIARCAQRGFEMRPNNGLRDPFEQAKLWRQSRSIEEIRRKMDEFSAQGATFLVECLRSVGPQHGDHVTDAPPGFSWHQWGEALDSFWLLDGKAEWSTKKLVGGLNAYHVYADEAAALGLTAGGHWKKFKDWPHVQLPLDSSPLASLSVLEIDAAMEAGFGG
jgi:peptidoglycan LD-endopeptidase CwlK